MRVAVVGATGIVGLELLRAMEARRFPVTALCPYGSGKGEKTVRFRGKTLAVPAPRAADLLAADLVFLVAEDEVARRWAPILERAGIWTIDESSAFRMRRNVPLVIPEINGETIKPNTRLISGPNCTVTGLAVAAHVIFKKAGARAVRLASYQAVSGAGRDALIEFLDQVRASAKRLPPADALPHPPRARHRAFPQEIAFNVLPHVGRFTSGGETGEEVKIREELRKLWDAPSLPVCATAVRVPVLRGHSLAVWMETEKPLAPRAAEVLFKKAPGVKLWPGTEYPTPRSTSATAPVHVGRVRKSGAASRELAFWVVSDNLLKGAALNTLQIAEHLLRKGYLRP